jgi:solute carrier family 25 folate transporter 32
MFSSSVSKCIACCVAYPHEIIRSRLQDAGHAKGIQQQSSTPTTKFRQYKNVRDAVQTIAKDEGLRGFYRGLAPTLISAVPAAVLTLLSYEKMREFLSDNFAN